ncbi:MAG: DegT/DnrJ/EryC1/StrS aminotransferase family protein [Firmicutes bacterium]|nr:DegT/DnrJ/EryC1/StrS aminotransferase family protein [Bacillota bacterium]
MRIPFSPPDITEEEIQEVAAALRSGWITTGPRTKQFEEMIAAFTGTPRAVCLNSATAALEMTLRILGIGPGDEVITTAYTYTASASIIDHVGAKIVLVDTDGESLNMDPVQLEAAITERTKAIIPVDVAGRMCDYSRVYRAIAAKQPLFRANSQLQALFGRVIVVADAAHSFGARQNGLVSGQVADFTCFSFHAVKNLTTAEGGAVVWKDREGMDSEILYHEYMLASLHGQSKDALAKNSLGGWEYDIVYPAYKCNMTDVLAAIGIVQFERYPELLKRRRAIITRYDEAFRAMGLAPFRHFDAENESSGHLYLLNIPGFDEKKRNALITAMAGRGVACNVHYKPLPMLTAYKRMGFDIKDYPHAYAKYENEVTLPLYSRLTDEEVEFVITALKQSLEQLQ